jgi:hypothetical protein
MNLKNSKIGLIYLLALGILGCTNPSSNEPKSYLLNQFYLSYDEWKTISCELVSDGSRYSDKAMIGLIEKSGKLRIDYLEQKIHLKPDSLPEIREGLWQNIYTNDTIHITVAINFDNKKKYAHCITGNGSMKGLINGKPFSENVFGIYQTKDFK